MSNIKMGFDIVKEEKLLKYHTLYKNLAKPEHYEKFMVFYAIEHPSSFEDFDERQKQNFYYWYEASKSLNASKTNEQKRLYSSIMSGFKLCYERIIEQNLKNQNKE